MSHLGDRLSALVDGELSGAELDRAHAHLASCERCRGEAADLRALKQKLRGLTADAPAEAEMTRRLIAITGPGGPLPPRRRRLRHSRPARVRRPGGAPAGRVPAAASAAATCCSAPRSWWSAWAPPRSPRAAGERPPPGLGSPRP